MNFSANGWGEPDERGQAVRELNRNEDFRKAVTMALDRKALGESLVKGPFTAIYPGGLSSGTSFYDRDSTVYYPFDLEGAKALLDKAGLKDTDGNGFVNFPAGTAGGEDVEIVLLVNTDYSTDKNLAEGVVARWRSSASGSCSTRSTAPSATPRNMPASFDWLVRRNDQELTSVVQNTDAARSGRPAAPAGTTGAGNDGDARPAAVRAGARRHRQQVHRQPTTMTSAPS